MVCSAAYGVGERIEVDYHEVDFGNLILRDLLTVTLVVATVENAAEHFGVKCLYASAKDRRVRSQILYGRAGVAELFDEGLGAACREKLHALGMEH